MRVVSSIICLERCNTTQNMRSHLTIMFNCYVSSKLCSISISILREAWKLSYLGNSMFILRIMDLRRIEFSIISKHHANKYSFFFNFTYINNYWTKITPILIFPCNLKVKSLLLGFLFTMFSSYKLPQLINFLIVFQINKTTPWYLSI